MAHGVYEYYCIVLLSLSLQSLRLLLHVCDLVKLHVAFFCSVLPFMVNKDEHK